MNNNQSLGIILGIFVSIIFAIGFICLAYNITVSILLGLFGGIASSFLFIWANTESTEEDELLSEEENSLEEKYSVNTPDNLSKKLYTINNINSGNISNGEKSVNDLGSTPKFNSSKDISLWQWLFKNNQRRFFKKNRSQINNK